MLAIQTQNQISAVLWPQACGCRAAFRPPGTCRRVAVGARNASQPSGILLLEHLVLRGGVSRFGGGAVFVALRGRFTGVGVWFDQNRAPVQVPRFSESDDFVQCCVDGPCALAGPGLRNLSAATRDAWNARQAPGGGGGGGECALATRQNQCKNNPVRSLCVWDVAADVCRPAWPGIAVTSGGSGGDYFSRKSNKPCGNGGALLGGTPRWRRWLDVEIRPAIMGQAGTRPPAPDRAVSASDRAGRVAPSRRRPQRRARAVWGRGRRGA